MTSLNPIDEGTRKIMFYNICAQVLEEIENNKNKQNLIENK